MRSLPSPWRAARARATARRRTRRTGLAAATALAAACFGVAALPAGGAGADIDPPEGTPPTVSADPLPTWQVNGVVWSMVTVGTTVYATGNFTKARPPGTQPGDTAEVARKNILAFDITTGDLVTSFNPSLNGQGLRIEASPDGQRVYVGGEFTTVNGQSRPHLAAFDTATGQLDPDFAPQVSAKVRGIAATNDTVYFGGNFFNVNGRSRTRLAAVKAADGTNVDTWRPTADDDEVFAMAMAGSGRVLIGGRFQKLNGQTHVGIGAVNTTNGASATWTSTPIPAKKNGDFSYVTDLDVKNGVVFASADGEGGHWFDGRFAANASNGDLVWLDNCYGATYGIHAQAQAVYSVSHAHDCSSLGGFPEESPTRWQRALAETSFPTGLDHAPPGSNSSYSNQPVPSLLHWYPRLGVGSFTGQYQAGWSVTGNADYIVMGGEFPKVNGKPQQGLVRFAKTANAPNNVGPKGGELGTPQATAVPGGVRVAWKTTWDMDDETLKYEVLRDGGSKPIGTVQRASSFWQMPTAGFVDGTAAPGSSHTYRVRAVDSAGNAVTSGASNSAQPGGGDLSPYAQEVAGDGPTAYWRLGGTSGPGYDYAGGNDLNWGWSIDRGQAGAIADDGDRAVRFGGGWNSSAAGGKAPTRHVFSLEAWVKTTSNRGGKIIGYGDRSSGSSSANDRHLYMTNDGRVVFGVYPDQVKVIQSGGGLNDGGWHHVVGTLDGTAGMKLYVDGQQVAADASVKSAEDYSGYWRLGGDTIDGWPSEPSSQWLAGTLDEVAVYPRALAGAEVTRHHGLGTGDIAPNVSPTAAFSVSCDELACAFDGSTSDDPDGSITSYAWDFGGGNTATGATPSYSFPTAGTHTVKLTVTDDLGATGTVTQQVTVNSSVLASDAFGRTVATGWGTADTGGTWNRNGSGGDVSVSGGAGRVVLGSPRNSGGGYLDAVSSTATDLAFTVSPDKVGTGNGVYVWAAGRRVDGIGDYRARIRLRPSGVVSLLLSRTDDGNAETIIAAERNVSGLTYQAGTRLRLRFQVTGTSPTTLKAKVWEVGTAEPDWQATATDSLAGLQTAGAVGLRTYLAGNTTNAPITVTYDDLKAVRATG